MTNYELLIWVLDYGFDIIGTIVVLAAFVVVIFYLLKRAKRESNNKRFIQIHNHIMRIDSINHIEWGHNEAEKEWTITVEFKTERPSQTFYFQSEQDRNERVHMLESKLVM